MSLINTQQYTFHSDTPIAIVNKTSKCGAMRPIAYYKVNIPRICAHIPSPVMKQSYTINTSYGDDIISKNIDTPYGDTFGKYTSPGILEVPLHSNYDPYNIIADQSHNLYTESTRKYQGAFDKYEDNIIPILSDWLNNDSNIKTHMFVDSGNLFHGIDNNGNDILSPVYVDKDPVE